MVSRRGFVITAGVGVLGAARWASAQPAGRSFRVGWVASSELSFREPQALAFVQRMAELGFVEGRNLVIERLQYDGRIERMPAVSAALGKLKCDAYFSGGGETNLAALTQASRNTPIVFVAVDFDPVATGDVASLARPGGRVTGVTALQSTLPAKRLELLKELLPGMGKVAVFTNDDTKGQLALVQGTARRLGLAVHVVEFRRPPFDFRAGFADASRARSDALMVLGSSLWVPARREITGLALESKLPTVFHQGHWVEAGGLMSYGFSFPKMWRRGAEMLADVLRGGKPGEMPMEQPTEFELAINLKTAEALGVRVPPSLLARADQVIR